MKYVPQKHDPEDKQKVALLKNLAEYQDVQTTTYPTCTIVAASPKITKNNINHGVCFWGINQPKWLKEQGLRIMSKWIENASAMLITKKSGEVWQTYCNLFCEVSIEKTNLLSSHLIAHYTWQRCRVHKIYEACKIISKW